MDGGIPTMAHLDRPRLTPAQRTFMDRINAEGVVYGDGRQKRSIERLVELDYILCEWTFDEQRQRFAYGCRAKMPATYEVWDDEEMRWAPCCDRCSVRVGRGAEEPRYPRKDVRALKKKDLGTRSCSFIWHTR